MYMCVCIYIYICVYMYIRIYIYIDYTVARNKQDRGHVISRRRIAQRKKAINYMQAGKISHASQHPSNIRDKCNRPRHQMCGT